MLEIQEIPVTGYEKVIEAKDSDRGLHCLIAVHNTTLGPSLGGTRIHPYSSPDLALKDVLRLARAMTYKSAIAQDGLGGGKSVIIADPQKDKTRDLLLAFGEVVNSLKGNYIAAEDVGSSLDDMGILRLTTPYVVAWGTEKSSGDPSRFTAWGIYRGIQAVAQALWGSPSLQHRTIAIQGLGHVGSKLSEILFWQGANLILTDIDQKKTNEYCQLYGAKTVAPEDFTSVKCDILAPCAMGGIINDKALSHLNCKAIAGGANNQLQDAEHGIQLLEKGILYAPDYIINAGGIINVAVEFEPNGYNPAIARDKVDRIFDTLWNIFQLSQKENKPTSEIADEIAEYNLTNNIGKRHEPIRFVK